MSDTMASMKGTRFYLVSATALVGLAVMAGTVLNLVGMKQDRVTTVVVTIMGFAALIMSQFRTASQVDRKADEVRLALEAATAEANRKADEVRLALEAATAEASRKAEEVRSALEAATAESVKKAEEVKSVLVKNNEENAKRTEMVADSLAEANKVRDEQLSNIQTVGEVVHHLVDGQHGVVLNNLAIALRSLANLTKDSDDAAAADKAEQVSEAHAAGVTVGAEVAASPPPKKVPSKRQYPRNL